MDWRCLAFDCGKVGLEHVASALQSLWTVKLLSQGAKCAVMKWTMSTRTSTGCDVMEPYVHFLLWIACTSYILSLSMNSFYFYSRHFHMINLFIQSTCSIITILLLLWNKVIATLHMTSLSTPTFAYLNIAWLHLLCTLPWSHLLIWNMWTCYSNLKTWSKHGFQHRLSFLCTSPEFCKKKKCAEQVHLEVQLSDYWILCRTILNDVNIWQDSDRQRAPCDRFLTPNIEHLCILYPVMMGGPSCDVYFLLQCIVGGVSIISHLGFPSQKRALKPDPHHVRMKCSVLHNNLSYMSCCLEY